MRNLWPCMFTERTACKLPKWSHCNQLWEELCWSIGPLSSIGPHWVLWVIPAAECPCGVLASIPPRGVHLFVGSAATLTTHTEDTPNTKDTTLHSVLCPFISRWKPSFRNSITLQPQGCNLERFSLRIHQSLGKQWLFISSRAASKNYCYTGEHSSALRCCFVISRSPVGYKASGNVPILLVHTTRKGDKKEMIKKM